MCPSLLLLSPTKSNQKSIGLSDHLAIRLFGLGSSFDQFALRQFARWLFSSSAFWLFGFLAI
jgi:hypothetical protein